MARKLQMAEVSRMQTGTSMQRLGTDPLAIVELELGLVPDPADIVPAEFGNMIEPR